MCVCEFRQRFSCIDMTKPKTNNNNDDEKKNNQENTYRRAERCERI